MNNALTHSAAKCFCECRRKYYYRFERAIEQLGHVKGYAVRYGSLYHGGLEQWWSTFDLVHVEQYLQAQCNAGSDESLIAYHTARQMIEGYVLRWIDEDSKVRFALPEYVFEVPLINPATGRRSRRFSFRGKIDLPMLLERVQVMEHKTAAAVDGAYLERLWTDSQITGYVAAMQDLGLDVCEVIYDVVVKPGIKLGRDETIDHYARRLGELYVGGYNAGKCKRRKNELDDQWWERRKLSGEPVNMYHREVVIIGDRQIAEWRADLWNVSQEILWARQHQHWPRNTSRCYDWGRACEYVPICQALGVEEMIIANEYQPRVRHAELDADEETPF